MNITIHNAILLFAFTAVTAAASAQSYSVSDANQKIDVRTDGRNTYIQAAPGLIVKGATADGDQLILAGVPNEIHASISGKPVKISRVTEASSAEARESTNAKALAARLSQLEKDLSKKEMALKEHAPVVATWEIRKTDGTIYGALSRWAAAAKPQRQLVFATEGNDFPADQEASFTGDFDMAVEGVAESLKHSNYPIRVCLWDNKPRPVVKIIHKNKRCED